MDGSARVEMAGERTQGEKGRHKARAAARRSERFAGCAWRGAAYTRTQHHADPRLVVAIEDVIGGVVAAPHLGPVIRHGREGDAVLDERRLEQRVCDLVVCLEGLAAKLDDGKGRQGEVLDADVGVGGLRQLDVHARAQLQLLDVGAAAADDRAHAARGARGRERPGAGGRRGRARGGEREALRGTARARATHRASGTWMTTLYTPPTADTGSSLRIIAVISCCAASVASVVPVISTVRTLGKEPGSASLGICARRRKGEGGGRESASRCVAR